MEQNELFPQSPCSLAATKGGIGAKAAESNQEPVAERATGEWFLLHPANVLRWLHGASFTANNHAGNAKVVIFVPVNFYFTFI